MELGFPPLLAPFCFQGKWAKMQYLIQNLCVSLFVVMKFNSKKTIEPKPGQSGPAGGEISQIGIEK